MKFKERDIVDGEEAYIECGVHIPDYPLVKVTVLSTYWRKRKERCLVEFDGGTVTERDRDQLILPENLEKYLDHYYDEVIAEENRKREFCRKKLRGNV